MTDRASRLSAKQEQAKHVVNSHYPPLVRVLLALKIGPIVYAHYSFWLSKIGLKQRYTGLL